MHRRHTVTEILEIASPLAAALDHAHRRGIVHRDFKPSNILLEQDGTPILADFGIARVLESAAQLTRLGMILGTPEYMAPEQALGRPADQRSDVYSFGVVLYELLLARPPFKAETPVAVLLAHVHEPIPRPTEIAPDLDPRLETTLLKALAKDPDQRYQSAGALADTLGTLLTTSAAPALPLPGEVIGHRRRFPVLGLDEGLPATQLTAVDTSVG